MALSPLWTTISSRPSKIDILRKLKQRFGSKVIRDVRFRIA
jgi:hypothetical protein